VPEYNVKNSNYEHRMTYLGDTLTVGLVLVLLFGSIALYLYTRIQQSEQKISLLESILLDLKMASEVQSYSELPAVDSSSQHRSSSPTHTPSHSSYESFNDLSESDSSQKDSHVLTLEPIPEVDTPDSTSTSESTNDFVPLQMDDENEHNNDVEEYKSVVADAVTGNQSSPKSSVQYEDLTLKELQTLVKTRGLSVSGTKKVSFVEALRASDRSTTVKPGSLSSSSFLETSVSVSNELA
jgi:hypothetical protein